MASTRVVFPWSTCATMATFLKEFCTYIFDMCLLEGERCLRSECKRVLWMCEQGVWLKGVLSWMGKGERVLCIESTNSRVFCLLVPITSYPGNALGVFDLDCWVARIVSRGLEDTCMPGILWLRFWIIACGVGSAVCQVVGCSFGGVLRIVHPS